MPAFAIGDNVNTEITQEQALQAAQVIKTKVNGDSNPALEEINRGIDRAGTDSNG